MVIANRAGLARMGRRRNAAAKTATASRVALTRLKTSNRAGLAPMDRRNAAAKTATASRVALTPLKTSSSAGLAPIATASPAGRGLRVTGSHVLLGRPGSRLTLMRHNAGGRAAPIQMRG